MDTANVWSRDKVPFTKLISKWIELDKEIEDRATQIGNIPVLTVTSHRNKPNTFSAHEQVGIQNSLITAGRCYCLSLSDACIVFASLATECVLNWDVRLQLQRMQLYYKWLDLDNKNLKLASDNGFPVKELLYPNEKMGDLQHNKKDPVRFVFLRNKFTHGDYLALGNIHYATEDGVELPVFIARPKNALEQLRRSIKFVSRWAEAKPEPEIVTRLT